MVRRPEGMNPREYEIMRSLEEEYWWYRSLRTLVLEAATRNLADIPAPIILDAGCGTGGTLGAFRTAFAQASLNGVDYSAEAIAFARARELGADLVQCDVRDLPFPAEQFDLVVSLDVLCTKNLDDGRVLREFHRVLKTGRALILNLPAFNLLRGAHDVAVQSGRRYTRGQLRRRIEDAGFAVEWVTYWNMILFAPILFWRLLSRGCLRAQEARSDLHRLPRSLNRVLETQLAFEFWLARRVRLPFGTSLFAIARKLP